MPLVGGPDLQVGLVPALALRGRPAGIRIAGRGGGDGLRDLDENDWYPVGILEPHLDQSQGSICGSRSTWTPAADSRSYSARTSRTWS